MYTFNTPETNPVWKTEHFQMTQWCHSLFDRPDFEVMRALPKTYYNDDLLVTHATPGNLFESVHASPPVEDLQEIFSGDETHMARGHNHSWLDRR